MSQTRRWVVGATKRRAKVLGGGGGGGGVSIFFQTEWRFGTGFTAQHITDDGTFAASQGTFDGVPGAIVAPDASLVGRGNYFRITAENLLSCVAIQEDFVAASTTHWGRCYIRNDMVTPDYLFNHSIAYGGIGPPIQFTFGTGIFNFVGTDLRPFFFRTLYDEMGAAVSYPNIAWSAQEPGAPTSLPYIFPTGTFYLCEWQIEYLTATTYWVRLWISEVDTDGFITNEDLFTNATFMRQDSFGGAGDSLLDRQGVSQDFGVSATDGIAGMRKLVVGNESTTSPATGESIYKASLAFSTEGRIRDQVLVF